ncbi:baseplate J/gp47 family protein [Anoxybacterium hadale]|uniref:Baseplate J/gp47 family protein n=1 Tax=Anoxybacterium hadale TaxID=3408580 RepID=A0ACD1ABJ0_9FIRM|nr:baseplate J/gp47 family protein [Clostridiales bacterium]
MFEAMTYDKILSEMLGSVTSDVDKREGSIVYDALAPCAYKLAEIYSNLSNYTDLFYLDTTVNDYLDKKAADYGKTRKGATYAVRKVETTAAVDLGTRWGLEDTTYKIVEFLSENVYRGICEQSGEIGNQYRGTLENISNVSGVTAVLSDIITSGTETESDEDFRSRLKSYIINPSQNGNAAQYLEWASDYDGIGAAKVFPLWNGGNTVKIAITNRERRPAEPSLVVSFQEYLDPKSEGLGNGVAPIGSKVTVTGGTQKNILVAANVTLNEGYSEASGTLDAITKYLASVTFSKNSVSYMRIGSVILDCESIAELNNLTINSGTSDIALNQDEIPVLTALNLTVVG